ncbi:hypothetical protein U9M48_016941 [Paspalum notatum var. saurae]|uniref:Fe2OG dioxygenase domain-containing protein n=1 Tax=Paspalum notatum var. saurae TaxID=547442 RepID=A0AAQ3T6L3_PASNO
MVSRARQEPRSSSSSSSSKRAGASMDGSPAPPVLLRAPTPPSNSIDLPAAASDKEKSEAAAGATATAVFDLRREPKIPAPFVWPNEDARPTLAAELEVPVVDVGVFRNGDAAARRRAAEQVAAACATHGFFQVCGHGVDAGLARAALDGASDFFRLPLCEKQRARRVPGTVSGYTSAHADRFASKLPWKETLSFGFHDGAGAASPVVVDYFASTLGPDFVGMGRVYQRYCEKMKELSLTIMELLELSLGLGLGVEEEEEGCAGGYYRDFFADSRSIMRCNYYPPCPEPERTLGTGPHCDPTALTILLQDDVGGLEVLVDGDWRPVRPVPGAMVINIGDTFMALSNGRYKSCLHRAVVNRRQERRSLAFFLCPREDRVVRPPAAAAAAAAAPRRYPDFTWADLMRFTQRHYRADTRTLDAFTRWLAHGPAQEPTTAPPAAT